MYQLGKVGSICAWRAVLEILDRWEWISVLESLNYLATDSSLENMVVFPDSQYQLGKVKCMWDRIAVFVFFCFHVPGSRLRAPFSFGRAPMWQPVC